MYNNVNINLINTYHMLAAQYSPPSSLKKAQYS